MTIATKALNPHAADYLGDLLQMKKKDGLV